MTSDEYDSDLSLLSDTDNDVHSEVSAPMGEGQELEQEQEQELPTPTTKQVEAQKSKMVPPKKNETVPGSVSPYFIFCEFTVMFILVFIFLASLLLIVFLLMQAILGFFHMATQPPITYYMEEIDRLNAVAKNTSDGYRAEIASLKAKVEEVEALWRTSTSKLVTASIEKVRLEEELRGARETVNYHTHRNGELEKSHNSLLDRVVRDFEGKPLTYDGLLNCLPLVALFTAFLLFVMFGKLGGDQRDPDRQKEELTRMVELEKKDEKPGESEVEEEEDEDEEEENDDVEAEEEIEEQDEEEEEEEQVEAGAVDFQEEVEEQEEEEDVENDDVEVEEVPEEQSDEDQQSRWDEEYAEYQKVAAVINEKIAALEAERDRALDECIEKSTKNRHS